MNRLKGLPQTAIDAAKADALAKDLGTPEKPQVSLHLEGAFDDSSAWNTLEDESIRRQVWEGSCAIGRGGEHDNTELVWKILRLRHEKAQIMGKANFADHVLKHRMAKNGQSACASSRICTRKVKEAFERETIELQEFRADNATRRWILFQPWEVAYWARRQRKAEYDFDEEELRPYFPLDKVLGGMFQLAEMVFDLRIVGREVVYRRAGQDRSGQRQHPPGQLGPGGGLASRGEVLRGAQ